jgi:hypothetical protein
MEKVPIVYVRGYAGGTSGINRQVDDPFYGFNIGSTHVRVGREGNPVFYQFESPLLRLLIDEDYEVLVEGSQERFLDKHEKVSPASIWIHRFYDVSASTWGERPREFRLENAARDLWELIKKLRGKAQVERVQLVAHSMGGLICRCLIQKIIPEAGERAADYVDRLFTYGTPHGGIEFDVGFGLIERLRDEFGIAGSDVFGRERMYEYLTPGAKSGDTPPRGWTAREMPDDDNFPLERLFCLIGTNPQDYEAALGFSSRAVGAKSDGLVQMENAYVVRRTRPDDARQSDVNHAFVHRSHSGRYGLVNSEEGYQNLRRFLFGDVKVTADLVGLARAITRPPVDVVWQAEAQLSIRGLPTVMSERLAAHYCPVQLTSTEEGTADRPVPLVTTFLWRKLRVADSRWMRFSLHFRILSLKQVDGIFHFDDHIEQTADFDDILVVDVEARDDKLVAWARWNSEITVPLREYRPEGDPLDDVDPQPGKWMSRVGFPPSADFLGREAGVLLTATDRG